MNIYCKETPIESNEYDFLKKYFDNGLPTTFYEDGSIQCGPGRQRTFDDLFSLTSSYFKDTTMGKVASTLRKLCKDFHYNGAIEPVIGTQYCGEIKADVFYNAVNHWCYAEFCNYKYYPSVESYSYLKKIGVTIDEIIKLADEYDKG